MGSQFLGHQRTGREGRCSGGFDRCNSGPRLLLPLGLQCCCVLRIIVAFVKGKQRVQLAVVTRSRGISVVAGVGLTLDYSDGVGRTLLMGRTLLRGPGVFPCLFTRPPGGGSACMCVGPRPKPLASARWGTSGSGFGPLFPPLTGRSPKHHTLHPLCLRMGTVRVTSGAALPSV